ncbi:P-loop NTPase fold protein [Nitrosomonas sp.]|uniref:KAP family P-loop NTPase fold protein n=1 Tax=Nitrosomonas sp. TaxID=42353 RepID=UPI00374D0F57
MNNVRPLALSRNDVINEAFEGDLLGRLKLAKQITGYLERLKDGAVVAIDAPWGEGKSWFGRHWAKYLQTDYDHKVIFINAFEQDYVEDPFLLIAAEITNIIEEGETKKAFKENIIEVGKTLAPNLPQIAINYIKRTVFECNKDLLEDVEDITKIMAEKLIEKKLKDFAKEKNSFQNFKTKLGQFCKKQDRPVVIFIDELDRCRPTFAVQIIERIKHLFDVPNLVFVLLLNRTQLENAIQGVYGPNTDAATYLRKFVNLFLRLPKLYSFDFYSENHPTTKYIANVLKCYKFETSVAEGMGNHGVTEFDYFKDNYANNFKKYLTFCAIKMDMSLRDIEHACALFVMANVINEQTGFIAYLISMKIKEVDLYARLLRNESQAHQDAAKRLDSWIDLEKLKEKEWPIIFFRVIQELHLYYANTTKPRNAEEYQYLSQYQNKIFDSVGYETLFQKVFDMIDLPIELER